MTTPSTEDIIAPIPPHSQEVKLPSRHRIIRDSLVIARTSEEWSQLNTRIRLPPFPDKPPHSQIIGTDYINDGDTCLRYLYYDDETKSSERQYNPAPTVDEIKEETKILTHDLNHKAWSPFYMFSCRCPHCSSCHKATSHRFPLEFFTHTDYAAFVYEYEDVLILSHLTPEQQKRIKDDIDALKTKSFIEAVNAYAEPNPDIVLPDD
jgi:hypothetical protein